MENKQKQEKDPKTSEKVKMTTFKKYVSLCLMKMNLNRNEYDEKTSKGRMNIKDEVKFQNRKITSLSSDDDYKILMYAVQKESPGETPVNINTWKKMNGQLKVSPTYRPISKNLNQIAHYFHCANWNEFVKKYPKIKKELTAEGPDSEIHCTGPIHAKNYAKGLNVGDYIRIYYEPNRIMVAKYLGANKFEVISQINISSLSKGDTFVSYNFFIGDRLHFMQWKHDGVMHFEGFSSSSDHHITKIEIEKGK